MFTKVPNIAIRLEYLHFNPVWFHFQFLTRPTAANRNFPYHVRTSQVNPKFKFLFSIFFPIVENLKFASEIPIIYAEDSFREVKLRLSHQQQWKFISNKLQNLTSTSSFRVFLKYTKLAMLPLWYNY